MKTRSRYREPLFRNRMQPGNYGKDCVTKSETKA